MGPLDIRGCRILTFCDYYSPESTGGAERVAREVCTRLATAGAKITVMSAVDRPVYRDIDVRVETIRAYDMSPYLGAQLAVSPSYRREATRVVAKDRPDVIYAHSLHFHGSIVAAQLSRRTGIPLVTVAHVADLDHLRGLTRTLGEAHERTAGRWIMSQSARMVAVSTAVRRHCIERGANGRKVTVVHNGVDHERFAPTDEPVTADPHILFVGRMIANKGPELLVAAAALLHRRGVRFRMTFVGDGPLLATVAATSVGLPVTCVGASTDVPFWMRSANVVVRPSFTEGLPLTVLEAMASQRCVVASDIAANREIVRHGVSGRLHRCGDAASLANELEQACRDHEARRALAAGGYERARMLSWERTARGHADVLAAAVAGRSLPAFAAS